MSRPHILLTNVSRPDERLQGFGDIEVQRYALGKNDLTVMGHLHGLRLVNERFCRIARSVFLPMLRVAPRIAAEPPKMSYYGDYSEEMDKFMSLTISRMEGLRGNQLLLIPPRFISLLTESYYGGSIRYTKNTRQEFTATEQKVIEMVGRELNRALEAAWRDLLPIRFETTHFEENLQFASFVDSTEMVVTTSFSVQLPEIEPATFHIVYPLQSLRPIAALLRSQTHSELVGMDANWHDRLLQAVLSVPLTVTAHLAEPEIDLGNLTNAREGDVVPVALHVEPRLLVEGRRFYSADVGEQNGKIAVSLKVPERDLVNAVPAPHHID